MALVCFLDQPVDRALNLVRLNCAGRIAFAHPALAAMRRRRRGGFILISFISFISFMSGMAGSGYVAAYAAFKSFEIVLAEGLHWEMAREGVEVMCAVATLTDTPAMRRSGMVEIDGLGPMDAHVFADGAFEALGSAPIWYAVAKQRRIPCELALGPLTRPTLRAYRPNCGHRRQ